MSSIKSISIVIKESPDQQDSIYKISIPKILLDKFEKEELNKLIILKVGFSKYKVETTINETDNCIELPQLLMKNLGLYNGLKCNAKIENEKLILGPVIAIFVSMKLIESARNQIVSEKVEEYIRANEFANCIICFFSIDDVDFINHRINGTFFNKIESNWQSGSFPFPDVLYDRGGSRTKIYLNITNYIREQFGKIDNMKKVNAQSFFDKLDFYEKLCKYTDIKPHLPLTKAYSKSVLRELFKTNKALYIKARIGSNGKSIMRVEKATDRLYRYTTARNEIISGTVNSLDRLIKEIRRFFKDRKLLIQTEIDLMKIDDCLVDMRATVQKNHKGVLGITTCIVRIAQKDSPVTSTASGSKVYSFEDFFKYIMDYSDYEMKKEKARVDEFLLRSYRYLEESYGSFGEIGIDIGMDDGGKLWFIECNSKPAKTTIHLMNNDDVLLKSYLLPLEYAKYISLFNEE